MRNGPAAASPVPFFFFPNSLDFLDRTQLLRLAKERNIAYVTPVLVEAPESITPQDRHPGSLGKEQRVPSAGMVHAFQGYQHECGQGANSLSSPGFG